MKLKQDWLWDRKISVKEAKVILREPDNKHFLSLAGLLLSRKNIPGEVFKEYLKPIIFLQNWSRIKKQMRKNNWNAPRIEFWQAIYENLKGKYSERGIVVHREPAAGKPQNEFCKAVAEKIKSIRKQKGLTQQTLAKKLKISQQVISRIEKGTENISLLTLKKIVDSLGAKLSMEIS